MKKGKYSNEQRLKRKNSILWMGIILIFMLNTLPAQGQNYAVSCDGNGDYINTPLNRSDLGSFSICVWYRFDGNVSNTYRPIIGSSTGDLFIGKHYSSSNIGIQDGNYNSSVATGTNAWDGNWHHLTYTHDGSQGKVYLDGVYVGGGSFSGGSGTITFGRESSSYHWHGLLDEIRIFDFIMDESEIESQMYSELTGNELGLLGSWNMNVSTGMIVPDLSANSYNGTLMGDAVFITSDSPVLPNNSTLLPFAPISPTGLPYSIIISDISIDGGSLPAGASIAVFDGNLCVGGSFHDLNGNTQIVAWEGDASQGLTGFTSGNSITIKVRTNWFSEMQIFTATPTFTIGNGTFGYGTFTVASLEITTGLTPDVAISTASINYNAVPINTSITDTVIVTNNGTATLTIPGISSSSSNFTYAMASNQLSSGTSDTLFITFTPTSVSTYSETLSITTDHPVLNLLTINLYGSGLPVPTPSITVNPSFLNYGGLAIGDTSTLSFYIYNGGNGDLLLSNISSNNPAYAYNGITSFTLTQNTNMELSVDFIPTTTGFEAGVLTITTNDGNIGIPLSGLASDGHFLPVSASGTPYHIIAENIQIDEFNLSLGDEVAVFDDTSCVGVGYSIANGGAVNFDGNGDYLGATMNVSETNYTVEMWFKSSASGGGIFSVVGGGHDRHIYLSNGNICTRVWSNETICTSGENYADGNWHHVAHVFGGSQGGQRIYVDGILKAQGNKSYSDFTYQTGINIGYSADYGYFNGSLDEVRIWNVAKSQLEIIESMNKTINSVSGLQAYFRFDGNMLIDYSGNNNTLTFYGNSHLASGGALLNNAFHIIAWEQDLALGYPGFTPGNPMSFKLWSTIFNTNIELDATATYTQGTGNFGFAPFTVVELSAVSGLDPIIEYSTTNLFVGQVEINQTITDSLYIYNWGNAPVNIDLSETSTQFAISYTGNSIAAGDSLKVEISFLPNTAGNHAAIISAVTNDPDALHTEIQLQGFGLPIGITDINVTPGSLAFNSVIVGTSESLTFNVINYGTAPLVVSDIVSDNAEFTVDPDNFTLTNTNDNQLVTVSYTPVQKGLSLANLTIQSNTNDLIVETSGVGFDGHFGSVNATGLPYTIIIEDHNLTSNLEVGDEIGVFDNGVCVGNTAIMPNGNSLYLDGSSDYLVVADDPSIDIGNNATVETWVRFNALSSLSTFLSKDEGSGNTNKWIFGYSNGYNGITALTLHINGVNGSTWINSNTWTPQTDQWYHVALVRNNNTYSFYIDGQFHGLSSTNISIPNINASLWIGGAENAFYLNGNMDETRIWNTTRSESQIQTSMNSHLYGSEFGLQAYWAFNGNTSDKSANNNHAVIHGNAHSGGEQVAALQNKQIQITVWEQDPSQGLSGFTAGNSIEFKAWLNINNFGSELNGTASYTVGDGTFGYGIFSVCDVLFDLPQIAVDPSSIFMALNEPDSTEAILIISNNGTENLIYKPSPFQNGLSNSLHVDGSGDYVNTGTWNAGSQWTIQAWVKPSDLLSGRRTIMGGFASCLDWGISLIDGYYAVAIKPSGVCSGSYQHSELAVLDEWAHITGTNDGTTAKLYINGILSASGPVETNYNGTNTSIRIGSEACCSGNNFPGLIDEVEVWNYAMSESEIEQSMYASSIGNETGLLGYWNFDDGTLNDLSGNGHNGSFAGNAFVAAPGAPLLDGWLSYQILNDTISPGSSDTLILDINSSGLIDGLYTSNINIACNDATNPELIVPVSLNVTGNAQIAASTDSLNFGEIIVGYNSVLDFEIQNIGTDSLFISSITTIDGANSNMSLLTMLTFPYAIPPLQSETISVQFQPTTDGFRTDSLLIASDGSNEDSLYVTLTGNGLTPADIELASLNWSATMNSGEILVDTFYISNFGQANLVYNIANSIPWLSLNPAAGVVGVGDSIAISMNVSTFGVYANTYSGSFQINSNDLIDPALLFNMNLTVLGQPEIYGEGSIDFGIVNVGETGNYSWLLQNIGSDTLHVSSIELLDPAFQILSATTPNVPPGASTPIQLQFTPQLSFNYSGIMTITSDAVADPIFSVAVLGIGLLPPAIALSTDTIVINETIPANMQLHQEIISNNGGEDLIYSLSLDNPAGSALNLDGNGDYLNIVNDVSLNPDTALTIEAWIKPADNNQEFIVAKEYSGVGTYRLFINASGKLQFQLNNSKSVISLNTIPLNVWTHVAASTNGKEMQVYINGVLDKETAFAPFTINANTFNLRVGRSYFNEYFNGQIDELRIWGIHKNDSEIAAYMHQTLDYSVEGLVLYYNFNGSGNIASDHSSAGNNGTLYGNATRLSSTVVLDDYLTVSPATGTIPSMSTGLLDFQFDAAYLSSAQYPRLLTINSNDPYNPTKEIHVLYAIESPANLSASAMSLAFANTYIGQSDTLDLILENTGGTIINIASTIFSHGDFSFEFEYPWIYPYSEKRIKVIYTPTLAGALNETVTISNDSPNHPNLVVTLNASGLEPPVIFINENAFSENLNYGNTIGNDLIIYNDGDGPLNWDLQGAIPSWLTLSTSTGVVSAHDSVMVTLNYNGTNDGGSYQTSLLLNSNDFNTPQIVIPVSLWIEGATLVLPATALANWVTYQETKTDTFYIENTGIGPLSYTLSESENWLSLNQTSGSVAIGGIDTILVTYDGNFPHGNYQSSIAITCNDPLQASASISVSLDILHATLVAIPTSLSFGYSVVNIGETKNLTVLNNGNVDLTIDSIYSVDPFMPQATTGVFLQAGQQISVPVFFLPNATLIFNETIYIATSIGLFSVPVHGIGENPLASWSYSWDMWDFGLVDNATGASKTLYIHNTGNIPWTMDDFDMSEEHFDVSDSIFTLNPGETKTVQVTFNPDAIAIYEATVLWTSNSIGTKELLLDGRGFFLSQAPMLTYVDDSYYNGTEGVYPLIGSTSTYFAYTVIYTDADNNPPMMGYPIVGIDKNGDTDFLDSGEDEFEMAEVDNTDLDYTDGKEYVFTTTLPLNFDLGYSFFAFDSLGNPPIGEGTQYQGDPFVSNDFLDLSIYANDINFSDLTPDVGQVITITATIHNNSDYPAENISVKFYEEDSFMVETFIPYLAGQSQTNVTITHVFTIDEYYPMKVVIDEDNFILEDNELNNFAIRPVLVGEFSIPGMIVATANVAPSLVQPYQTVHWYGHADYVGSYDPNTNVSGAQVTMTIVETGHTYTTYTNSNGDFSIYFQAPATVGTYHITGEVTDFTLLAATNMVAFTVYVPQVVDPIIGPDLAITYWWGTDIHWTSECRRIGDPIDVTAIVTNIGNATAYNALVHVFQDANLIMNPIYDSIPAGTNKIINFTVTYNTVGYHSVSVDIDPYNTIAELSEWNNYGSRTRWIYPLEPDLKPTNAWASDNSPLQGQAINLTFRIDNLECTTSDNTTADFYHIFGTDTTYIGTEAVDAICSTCADYVYLYNLVYNDVGWHKVLIVVDPDDLIYETNEANNELIISFYVEQAIADLKISDISFSAYNPNMGDLINFTATIWNNGTADATDFYVRFYMDNGQIGDSILVPLLPSGINMLVTSDPWEVSECPHEVAATVDEENLILETNEYNNYTERAVGYDFNPSLWPYYWSSYISVLNGTPITLKSRIYNDGTLDADTVYVTYRIKEVLPNNQVVYTVLGYDGVPFIHHEGHSPSSLITTFNYTGDYDVEIYADLYPPDSTRYCEISETNNWVILHVHVYGEDPDLQVLSQHISPTELNPDPGELIDIYGSFTNEGNVPAGPFWVKFYANSIELGDSVFVSGLAAHEDSTVACTEQFSSTMIGTHVIRVEVDANHMVVETNEMNNMASRAIIVGDAPDHTFSDAGAGIWLSDTLPNVGDTILINPIIENNGGATGTADLNLYYTFLGVNYPITTFNYTAAPYDSTDMPFQWVVEVPYGRIYAEITNANPEEFNIFNNLTYIDFGSAIDPLNIQLDASDNLICLGDTVSIVATPQGGLGSYITTWTSSPAGFISTASSIEVAPTETTSYTVTVDDGFHTASASTTIQVIDLALDLGSDLVLCGNDSATLDAGNFDTYLWSTGATTQSIVVDDNGTYWVEVEMSNYGCSARDTVIVSTFPGIPTSTQAVTICEAPYLATLDAPAQFAAYNWSTGDQSQSITVDDSGEYYVTVYDQNGCSAIDTFQVSMYDMDINLGPDTTLCDGNSLLLDAGSGYDYYLWSNFNQSQQITVTNSDYYWVEASIGECFYQDTIQVSFISSIVVDLGTSADLCEGENLTLDPGVFASYQWNDQSTLQTLTVDTSGYYSVTVSNQSGCSGSASITVNLIPVPDLSISDQLICEGDIFSHTIIGATDVEWSTGLLDPTINISAAGTYSVIAYYGSCAAHDTFTVTIVSMPLDLGPDTSICEGASITIDAGANFLSYFWSNASSAQSITVNEGDTYYVTVTGANQCQAMDSITILLNYAPIVSLDTTSFLCEGSFTTLDAGVFSSYIWNDQSTGQTLSTSAPGIFSVTVTDQNGCTNSGSTEIIEIPLPDIYLGADTSICEGEQLQLDAGNFASYLWSTQATSPVITVSTGASYGVTVSDGFGCSASDVIDVTVIPLAVDLGDDIFLCPASSTILDAGIYQSYLWSTGSTSQTIMVNQAGLYSLTVSSAEGCTNSDSINVYQAINPVIDLGPDIEICEGESIEIYSNYFASYAWNTGSFNQSIIVSQAGTYALTVTNEHGCSNSDTIDLFVHQLPLVSFSGLNGSYCTNSDNVLLTGTPTGGTFTGAGVLNSYFEPYTLNPGSYNITYNYTDANGCFGSSMQTAIVYDIPNVTIVGLEAEYFSDAQADTLQGSPVGGLFSGDGMTLNIFDPVSAGVGIHYISYTYTDTNACSDTYISSTLVSTVYDIYGYLKYDNQLEEPIGNTDVLLLDANGSVIDTDANDNLGYFEFLEKHNGIYGLDFTSSTAPGGLNATDALKIRRHIVYLEPLSGLKLEAADVNASSSISSADALLVLRRTVGFIGTFPAGDWLFEQPTIEIDNANVNLVVHGISYGDVNASYTLSSGTKQEQAITMLDRSNKLLIKANNLIKIPVYLHDATEAGAVTCILKYPSNSLSIQTVNCTEEGYLFNVIENEIRIAVANIDGIAINENEPLFEIIAQVTNTNIDNSAFEISSMSEVADRFGEINFNAKFSIPELTANTSEIGFELACNYPNPFKQTTTFAYTIPEEAFVKLSIVNLLGEELEVLQNTIKSAGRHSHEYHTKRLSAGMYFYKIEVNGKSQDFNAVGSMQIIK